MQEKSGRGGPQAHPGDVGEALIYFACKITEGQGVDKSISNYVRLTTD